MGLVVHVFLIKILAPLVHEPCLNARQPSYCSGSDFLPDHSALQFFCSPFSFRPVAMSP